MHTVKFKFDLGDKVKDQVTNLTGIIDACSIWLNGCVQYSVQPKVDKDNARPKGWWMDEAQLKLIKSKHVKINPKDFKKTGGPSLTSPNQRASTN